MTGSDSRRPGDHPDRSESDAERLLELAYERLHELAGHWIAREPPDHTLQPTALVHEAYLRMLDQRVDCWQGRTHFLGVAALAMRRVLLDHARRRRTARRGGAWRRVALTEVAAGGRDPVEVEIETLSDALGRLDALHPGHARVVELRFLAGLSVQETADVLGIAPRTVKLHWRMARAWLLRELEVRV